MSHPDICIISAKEDAATVAQFLSYIGAAFASYTRKPLVYTEASAGEIVTTADENAIAEAAVVVVLVSANLIADDYQYQRISSIPQGKYVVAFKVSYSPDSGICWLDDQLKESRPLKALNAANQMKLLTKLADDIKLVLPQSAIKQVEVKVQPSPATPVASGNAAPNEVQVSRVQAPVYSEAKPMTLLDSVSVYLFALQKDEEAADELKTHFAALRQRVRAKGKTLQIAIGNDMNAAAAANIIIVCLSKRLADDDDLAEFFSVEAQKRSGNNLFHLVYVPIEKFQVIEPFASLQPLTNRIGEYEFAVFNAKARNADSIGVAIAEKLSSLVEKLMFPPKEEKPYRYSTGSSDATAYYNK